MKYHPSLHCRGISFFMAGQDCQLRLPQLPCAACAHLSVLMRVRGVRSWPVKLAEGAGFV